MKQDFATRELKNTVESFYGVKLRSLRKIATGAQSVNFLGVVDGLGKIVVKVVPSLEDALRIVSNCRCVRPVNDVECLFDGKTAPFRGGCVLCLSYCEGREIRFEEYDFALIDELIRTYAKLSHCMQSAVDPRPCRSIGALIRSLDQLCRDLPGRDIYRAVIRDCRCEDRECTDAVGLSVVHGDLHFANFKYVNGTVSGIFDFMEFRLGYPTEDYIRLVLCSAERLRWYRVYKMRKIFRLFAYLVSKTGYRYRQWEAAIDGYFLTKMVKKAGDRKGGPLFALEMRSRMRLYRRLKEIAFDCCNGGRRRR